MSRLGVYRTLQWQVRLIKDPILCFETTEGDLRSCKQSISLSLAFLTSVIAFRYNDNILYVRKLGSDKHLIYRVNWYMDRFAIFLGNSLYRESEHSLTIMRNGLRIYVEGEREKSVRFEYGMFSIQKRYGYNYSRQECAHLVIKDLKSMIDELRLRL